MNKEVIAAVMAASSELDLMTLDRIEACTKGHGSLNMAVIESPMLWPRNCKRGRHIRQVFKLDRDSA